MQIKDGNNIRNEKRKKDWSDPYLKLKAGDIEFVWLGRLVPKKPIDIFMKKYD